jgi:Flp pilus assembly protein TadG
MKSTRLNNDMRRNERTGSSGQAMVEFALVLFVAMIVLFVAIQMAFIGQAALALGQINYQGARFAAVNQCATPSDIATYMVLNGSPTITKGCGSKLTVTVSDNGTSLGTGTPSCSGTFTPPTTCGSPRSFGDSILVSVTFNTSNIIFLSKSTTNPNFFGIPFPKQLASQETSMSE